MAGIIVNEGRRLINEMVLLGSSINRGSTLKIGLMTNTSVGVNTTLGSIVEPTGGGYVRQDLPSLVGGWSITTEGDVWSLNNEVIFLPTGTNYVGDVSGYFVCSSGSSPKLLFAEVTSGVPYQVVVGDPYGIRFKVSLVGA